MLARLGSNWVPSPMGLFGFAVIVNMYPTCFRCPSRAGKPWVTPQVNSRGMPCNKTQISALDMVDECFNYSFMNLMHGQLAGFTCLPNFRTLFHDEFLNLE